MAVRRKPTIKRKSKIIPLIEMEASIMKMFGIRENIIVPNISWGFDGIHEIDLFVLRKSGLAIEVEIKRSISDLKADFKKGHNHESSRITKLYYAIPKKLLEKSLQLIPEEAGIIICYRLNDNERNIARASIYREAKIRKNSRKLTPEEQFKIARLGCMRIFNLKNKIIKLQNNKL
jgi:hypothetical protein